MRNRRWAIIAGLAVVELWIVGLILRSIGGGHGADVSIAAPSAALASPAAERGATSQTIPTSAAPRVMVDDEDSSLTVTVRAGTAVEVFDRSERHGWIRGHEAPLRVEKTADGVNIVRGSSGMVFTLGGSFDHRLELVVPPETRLDVRNAATTTVTGLRAEADLHSDDGSIFVRDQRGSVHVTSANGRIEFLDVVAPSIDASSDDGRITLDRVVCDAVSLKTDNGRIDVDRSLVRSGKIQTDDGRVMLGLDPQSNVTVSARASDGSVVAQPPLVVRGAGGEDDTPTMIQLGTGSGRLDVASGDGSISVRAVGERS